MHNRTNDYIIIIIMTASAEHHAWRASHHGWLAHSGFQLKLAASSQIPLGCVYEDRQ